MFNLDKIREETPGCRQVIHLNNAGASLMPLPVVRTMERYLEEEMTRGGYETAALHRDRFEATYEAAARLIGARPGEIALTENATMAWNLAFFSVPFRDGDRILTSVSEYASNYLAFLRLKRQTGVTIEVIPDDAHGQASKLWGE